MWPIIGLVLKYVAAAATAYQGVSSYQTSKASAKQAEYNAEADAERKSREAEQSRLNRQAGERQESKEAHRRRAAAEAAYAKSGVLIEGTPGEFLAEQAGIDEQNIQDRTRAAEARTLGIELSASDSLTQGRSLASGYRAKGTGDLIGGFSKSGGSALSATASWLSEEA